MEKLFPPCLPGFSWKVISSHCHIRATGHRIAFCQGWQRGGDRAKQWAEGNRERGAEQQAMGLGTSLGAQQEENGSERKSRSVAVLGCYKIFNQ